MQIKIVLIQTSTPNNIYSGVISVKVGRYENIFTSHSAWVDIFVTNCSTQSDVLHVLNVDMLCFKYFNVQSEKKNHSIYRSTK